MQFMTHPEHGAHNAQDGEVEAMIKNGWSISTREEWMAGKFSAVKPVADQPAKKRGRPAKAE